MTAAKHDGDDEGVVRLLAGAAALVGSVRNCWLITRPDRTVTARPMGVVALENSDHDWKLVFLTDSRSRKSSEIARAGNVMVIVQREPDEAYATFSGRAAKITDPAVVASRWKEAYGRYFPKEADRSNAIFIEITIERMELWIRGVTPEPFGFVPAVVERVGGGWRLDSPAH
jgi:general stress protein 26